MTPYETLGVTEDATDEEIKQAYRRLAQLHHPDREGGSEAAFKAVGEAYELVNTGEKRQQLAEDPSGINAQANEELISLFTQYLSTEGVPPDPLVSMRGKVQEFLAGVEVNETQAQAQLTRLHRVAKRLRAKGASELLTFVVRKQIAAQEARAAHTPRNRALGARLLWLLDQWEWEPDAPPAPQPSPYGQAFPFNLLGQQP